MFTRRLLFKRQCHDATWIQAWVTFINSLWHEFSSSSHSVSLTFRAVAMRPIRGCPENFRDSLTIRPRLLFPKFFMSICSDRPYECSCKWWPLLLTFNYRNNWIVCTLGLGVWWFGGAQKWGGRRRPPLYPEFSAQCGSRRNKWGGPAYSGFHVIRTLTDTQTWVIL